MSNKEKCLSLLDGFTEGQLANIAAILKAAKDAMDDAAEEAFCRAPCQEYDADPDKGRPIPIEEAARQLGVSIRPSCRSAQAVP